jgi:predicted lipoprotein
MTTESGIHWDDLSADEQMALEQIDYTIWATFREVYPYRANRGVVGQRLKSALVKLKTKGLVASRVSDAHGKVEYALTEAGIAMIDREASGDGQVQVTPGGVVRFIKAQV